MDDGIIELDSEHGTALGFTSDRFAAASYLWKTDNAITVSAIVSLKRGNFRKLVDTIRGLGFAVRVPTPSTRMRDIVTKAEYKQTWLFDENFGADVEVWVLDAP